MALSLPSSWITFILLDFHRPEESNLTVFNQNWATVWIKMGSSWACVLLYLVSLPLRRFGRYSNRMAGSVRRGHHTADRDEVYERETVTWCDTLIKIPLSIVSLHRSPAVAIGSQLTISPPIVQTGPTDFSPSFVLQPVITFHALLCWPQFFLYNKQTKNKKEISSGAKNLLNGVFLSSSSVVYVSYFFSSWAPSKYNIERSVYWQHQVQPSRYPFTCIAIYWTKTESL